MIKQAMSEAGLAPLAVAGLMIFVAVFVGVAVWAMTRRRGQVAGWSSLPLNDGPTVASAGLPITGHTHGTTGGCGKCSDCTCSDNEAVTPITINE